MKNNEKKNGGYYLELLPSDIQSKIVANLSKFHPNNVAEEIVRMKEAKFISLADMLGSIFEWDKTNEGREYWESVIDKKLDGKNFEESVSELFDIRVGRISDVLTDKLNDLLTDVFGSEILKYAKQNEDISKNPNAFKTGREYMKELSESEGENFINNLESIGRNVEEYMSYKYHSFDDFMASSFPFFATKEGVRYWSKIRNRETPESLDDVLSELNIRKSE